MELFTVGLIVGAFALFYAFIISNLNSWKKRSVPEAKSYPIIGTFPSAFTQKRHMVYDMDEVYRQFKNSDNFVGIFSARSPQLLVIDPELVHKILVNDFKSFRNNEMSDMVDEKSDSIMGNNPFVLKDDAWKERRLELTPGMTPHRIKSAYPVTVEVCKRLSDFIEKQSEIAGTAGLDAIEICLRYTTEVVSDVILGIHVATLSNEPSELLSKIQNIFTPRFSQIVYHILLGIFPSLKKIYKTSFFTKEKEKYFYDLMENAIELRRKEGRSSRVDFLNFMLELQAKKNLPNHVLSSHLMTFLIDGFITTAYTIGHCLLGLARNVEAQEKLRAEIEANINDEGVLTFESLNEMDYLDACFHEALRLFPPGAFSTKICTEPYEFVNKNGKSFRMKPNEAVLLPYFSIHLDEQFYEDPQEFKPERFLTENGGAKKYRDEGKFFGFGDGPRICLGMRFALTQGKAAIAELIRKFDIKVNPKTRSDNLLDPKEFISRIDGGVWLDFVPRT